jgi:hypothetical protein
MANADLEPGALFKWHQRSRVDAQLEQQHELQHTQRAVYRHVTEREAHRCRVCGQWCSAEATSLLARGEHHHIIYASAGGPTTPGNVALLCTPCHNEEHQHRLKIEGMAEGPPWLTLWRRDHDDRWYVWKQETGVREYARD